MGLCRKTLLKQNRLKPVTMDNSNTFTKHVESTEPGLTVNSPVHDGSQTLSSLTFSDLNKIMWTNITTLQQSMSDKLTTDLLTMVKEIVTDITQEFKKIVSNITDKCDSNKKQLDNLIQENDKLKDIVAAQQKYLSTMDASTRKRNVIITGVAEKTPLVTGEHSATNDREKVKKIFDIIGCASIPFSHMERLGREGDRRPIKVVLDDPDKVNSILHNTSKLKKAADEFKRVFIKKDTHPLVRKELARLREVVKREKLKPENAGKIIYMDYKLRKVFVDKLEVDSYTVQPF